MSTKYVYLVIVFYVILLCVELVNSQHADQVHKPYVVGEIFGMECKNSSGLWDKGPICEETGKEMTFTFGVDTFHHCGWQVQTSSQYEYLKLFILRNDNWSCRVRMSPLHDFYIPFTLPIWGVIEPDHSHIDNHMNYVFHADNGNIIAATAYPVRDRFQMTKAGTVLMMHGPVKWFDKHSFKDFSTFTTLSTSSNFGSTTILIVSITFTFVMASACFVLSYRYYYRPKLLRSVLKKD